MNTPEVLIRSLGMQPYQETWQAMRDFTDQRNAQTTSEIWITEHPAVFTQGQAGKPEHILNAGNIPIVQTDRGGQVTYHGPDQLIIYLLLNLKEINKGVRSLVSAMEDSIIELMQNYSINANADKNAPGVYVDGAKLAALGLRIRKGNSYHGLALNVNTDLQPFSQINPCGYADLAVTSLQQQGISTTLSKTADKLIPILVRQLGYKATTA